jgi:hypothetical protein
MSFRFSLLLIVVGAAIIFLVDYQSQGVDIRTLGYVFVAGGIGGVALTLGRRLARPSEQEEPAQDLGTAVERRREERLRERV